MKNKHENNCTCDICSKSKALGIPPQQVINSMIREKIDKFGVAVLGSFLDERNEDGISYTVGRHGKGQAELIMFGMHPQQAHPFINRLHDMDREFTDFESVELVKDYPFILRELPMEVMKK